MLQPLLLLQLAGLLLPLLLSLLLLQLPGQRLGPDFMVVALELQVPVRNRWSETSCG